jgi:hypothetical protein
MWCLTSISGTGSERVRDEARALGADVCLYRLACSDEEAWRRIERRNADLTSGLFIARNT